MSTPLLQTGHVGLNVTDLARSTDFYRTVFGFDVLDGQTEGDQRFTFLGLDGAVIVTLWQQSEGTFATHRPGLHHMSFEVPDIDAVRRAEGVLKEIGTELYYEGIVPHGDGASSGGVYFSDPDGTRLEIYASTGADTTAPPIKGAPTCGFF